MNKVAKAKMRNPFKSWTSGAGTTQNKTTHSVEIKVAAQAQKIPAINTSIGCFGSQFDAGTAL
ncbi:MAG TPA: hypothetical protein VIH75_17615 [Candidatus Sulfotelmatobacter sp.]